MQIKVCKVRLAVLFLSLVRYKAEAKQLVIFLNFKKSHTTQVKNKMCKTKSQIRQEAFIYCWPVLNSFIQAVVLDRSVFGGVFVCAIRNGSKSLQTCGSSSSPTAVARATCGVIRLNMSHCQQSDARELNPMTAFPLRKERSKFVRITNSSQCL